MVKNVGSMRSKGINEKVMPQCTTFLGTLQNLKYVGTVVTEFCFFDRIPEKKKNIAFLCLLCTYYIKLHLDGVNFCGDLHLDVSRCSNKLKLKVKIVKVW